MFLSKNAKRFMSTVAVLAMTVSSLVVAPKVEATTTPTVVVKGATLRLEGNEAGKQSMRIAVEVSNADAASACGMEIKYNGKTFIIASDNGYERIYDYNNDKNKVMYTAVIENIPSTAFSQNFEVKGLVKKASDTTYKETASVNKSVNGIVSELKGKNSSIDMVDGYLVKTPATATLNENQTIAVKDNINNFNYWKDGNSPQGDATYVFSNDSYNVTTDSKNGRGIGYQYGGSAPKKALFVANVNATNGTEMRIVDYGGTEKAKAIMSGDWMKVAFRIDVGDYNANYFTVNAGGQYSIKDFVVYEALTQSDMSGFELAKDTTINLGTQLCVKADWFYTPLDKIKMDENNNLQCQLYSAKETDNVATSVKFNTSGIGYDLNEYSKIIVKLKSDKNNTVQIAVSKNKNLANWGQNDTALFDRKGITFEPGIEQTLEFDCSSVSETTMAYGISMQNLMYGDKPTATNPTITISEIKLLTR